MQEGRTGLAGKASPVVQGFSGESRAETRNVACGNRAQRPQVARQSSRSAQRRPERSTLDSYQRPMASVLPMDRAERRRCGHRRLPLKERTMMRPVPPGEVLREQLEELRMSATQLAAHLGVPTNRITGILNAERALTADTALRLSKFFGTTAEFWLA